MNQIPINLLMRGITEQAFTGDFYEGIKAAVWMYYEEYTDATDIVDGLFTPLETISRLLCLDSEDLYAAIRQAESDYNTDLTSSRDSEGNRRKVGTDLPTYDEDEDDE